MQFYSDLLTAVWNIQHLGQTYVLWARLVWYWPVDDTSLLWTRSVFSRPNWSGPDQTVLKPDPKPDGVWSRVHRCDQRGLVWLRCFIFQAKIESERELFFTKLCFLVVFSFQMNPKQFKQTWSGLFPGFFGYYGLKNLTFSLKNWPALLDPPKKIKTPLFWATLNGKCPSNQKFQKKI